MHVRFTQSDRKLIVDLYDAHVIKVGTFRLRMGEEPPYSYVTTPFLIDVRVLVSYPPLMKRVAKQYVRALDSIRFHRMVAIPYAALPIVAAVSSINNKPWIYPRRETKVYGTKNPIEGEFFKGEHVVVLDDTVTTGATLIVAIRKLLQYGLQVRDVVLLVDRGEEGIPKIKKQGIRVHAIYHIDDMLELLCASRKISKEQLASIQSTHEELKESVIRA